MRSSLKISDMTDRCGLDHRRLRRFSGDESAMVSLLLLRGCCVGALKNGRL